MKSIVKLCARAFAATILVTLAAAPAFAGLCNGDHRPFPGLLGQDSVNISCGVSGTTATTGVSIANNINGKHLITSKTAGAAGVGVGAEGYDPNGVTIVCSSLDLTVGGSNPTTTCPANTAAWRPSVSFFEL